MDNKDQMKADASSIQKMSDDIVNKTQGVFEKLEVLIDRTKKINDATKTIQAIANKTNMLSLNASIESARAGEYGRGFSVVAQQMQQLANTSKEASSEVFVLLKELSGETAKIEEELNSLLADVNMQSDFSKKLLEDINVED